MTREDIEQRTALRRIQNIVVLLLIAVLSALLVRHWVLDEGSSWRRAEVDLLVRRFSDNVSRVRVLWMSSGKPAELEMETREGNRIRLPVTKSGWPKVDGHCAELWQSLTGVEELGELTGQRLTQSSCQFYWNGQRLFQYHAASGQVITE